MKQYINSVQLSQNKKAIKTLDLFAHFKISII